MNRNAKIISVMNLKGGVGKTTTAINMTVGLATRGAKTLIVDLDQQANSTNFFTDAEIEKGMAEVLSNPDVVKGEIINTAVKDLDLLPANIRLAFAERNIMLDATRATFNRLEKALKKIEDRYDYIVIDCPPVLNLLTTNALYASHQVIVPIKIDKYALDGYRVTIENIEAIRESFGMEFEVKVLFTMVNRNNLDRRIISEFDPCKCYSNTIRQQAKPIAQSSFDNEAVIQGRSNVGMDYQVWMDEFLGIKKASL